MTYTFFNFRDPVVGGFAPAKLALRRALIMSYNNREEIEIVRKGQAVLAEMPIPAGVVGHDRATARSIPYDPVLANKLLDHYGYKKGADGWRTMPDGKPLVIRQATGTSQIDRTHDELWKKGADAIGVRMVFDAGKFGDTLKQAKACHIMMWGAPWSADYPDGENFMQLALRPEHRPEQQRLLRVEELRRALRQDARDAARRARPQPAVPRHVAPDGRSTARGRCTCRASATS
jgi:ABC-type transport system substrate-binding protein